MESGWKRCACLGNHVWRRGALHAKHSIWPKLSKLNIGHRTIGSAQLHQKGMCTTPCQPVTSSYRHGATAWSNMPTSFQRREGRQRLHPALQQGPGRSNSFAHQPSERCPDVVRKWFHRNNRNICMDLNEFKDFKDMERNLDEFGKSWNDMRWPMGLDDLPLASGEVSTNSCDWSSRQCHGQRTASFRFLDEFLCQLVDLGHSEAPSSHSAMVLTTPPPQRPPGCQTLVA